MEQSGWESSAVLCEKEATEGTPVELAGGNIVLGTEELIAGCCGCVEN